MCQSCPAESVFTAEHFPRCQFCSSGPGCEHPGMMDSFKTRGLHEVPAVQVHIGSAWLNHLLLLLCPPLRKEQEHLLCGRKALMAGGTEEPSRHEQGHSHT